MPAIGIPNIYSYVGGNPNSWIDPEGLQAVTAAEAALGGIGLGITLCVNSPPCKKAMENAIASAAEGARADANELQREIAKEANRREYKRICNEPPPPGLDPCERAKWELRKAQNCKAAREENTRRWWGGKDTKHSPQLAGDLERAIQNAQRAVDRACKCK